MQNILIVKFGALGDVIRTSYILPGLHEKYSFPKICWLTSSFSFDLLRFNPFISTLLTPEFNFGVIGTTNFDLVISLDDEENVLKMIEGIRCKNYLGAYLENGRPAYNDRAAEWFDMGLISRFGKNKADELKKLNTREHNQIFADMLDIEIREPIFYNSCLMEKKMSGLFDNKYFNIGINSGAGSRWISKQLPLDELQRLIEKIFLSEIGGKPTCVYLLGGKEEEERHAAIKSALASDRLIDSGTNNSLLEFAVIIKHCDYIIASDSLALHLAISQRVKNLSFYAPTSAAEIGTFGTGVKVISLANDYCSYKKDADNSTITAKRIFAEMKEHLQF